MIGSLKLANISTQYNYVAPPGPPQNFSARAISDTEIILTWDNLFVLSDNSVAYEICFNLTPTCVEGPVSVGLYNCDTVVWNS